MILVNRLAASTRLHVASGRDGLRSVITHRQSLTQLRQTACASAAPQSDILRRPWLLPEPDSQVRTVNLGPAQSQFQIIQDDLLHPVLGGNKLRKLDGLLPELQAAKVTDVLTCGGVQSAHTAAVAAACAEHDIRAHLLIRGERPAVPAGFHLLARMYGQVKYVTRTEYADRDAMLEKHAKLLLDQAIGDMKVHVIPEGAGEAAALLGCIRLVNWLAQPQALGPEPLTLVLDCGTGTTATGLAMGIQLAQLPWTVHGVMLAGPLSYYQQQQTLLTALFADKYLEGRQCVEQTVTWVQRSKPRRFGKVFKEDVLACQQLSFSARACNTGGTATWNPARPHIQSRGLASSMQPCSSKQSEQHQSSHAAYRRQSWPPRPRTETPRLVLKLPVPKW